jgi:metal-dependent amidase/aminoacylase/carboxypeptidase family protein
VNSEGEPTEVVKRAAGKVAKVEEPAMMLTGEDFSFYLQQRPGCFFFLGSAPRRGGGEGRGGGEEEEAVVPHHVPTFDFDEDALLVGASIWVQLVEEILGVK